MSTHQRQLTLAELDLLLHMLRGKPNAEYLLAALPTSEVEEMDDGGMDSLRFVGGNQHRRLGEIVAELQFNNEDGVPVWASVNLDEEGKLFELDLFKADFLPLKRLPIL